MNANTEVEKKFFVADEASFSSILYPFTFGNTFCGYLLRPNKPKERRYYYFDTFEGDLTERNIRTGSGLLEKDSISVSARKRETDCVLTVKIPLLMEKDTRTENELFIEPAEGTLESIDLVVPAPLRLKGWEPLQKIYALIRNKPLQRIIELNVCTHRIDLLAGDSRVAEISFDQVKGEGIFYSPKISFFELEVEAKTEEGISNLEKLVTEIKKIPRGILIESPLPKWIKTVRLMRGEKIY